MQFIGRNKLVLSTDSIKAAIEAALNASRRDGEDYIYVTDMSDRWAGEYTVTISTDAPIAAPAMALPVDVKVAA